MSVAQEVPLRTYQVVDVVSPDLARRMSDYMQRLSVRRAGYEVLTDWHPVIPEGWGEFPPVPVQRGTVYAGSAETWAYSHHQAITKFRDTYVASWSNGFLHEDYVGQQVHCAHSSDGLTWSAPVVVAPTPVDSGLVRNNAGLYATEQRLYCYVGVADNMGRDVAPPGMMTLKDPRMYLEVYETDDLTHWTRVGEICEDVYLFEGPRVTRGGRLLCCGRNIHDRRAMVLVWDDPSRPASRPRVVFLEPRSDGVTPVQGTWYQTDDGRVWLYHRDDTLSLRLGLCWSDDEGDTWSDIYLTNFPNTYSRAYAGRLNDGRYYIAGNNYSIFLDRLHLLVALSDDGREFTRQYTIVEGETTRRINGRHKEDGYHYPNCIADGDRLLVIYSVNKEDIEVAVADMSAVE
jgi:hypothetical protein